MTSRDFFDWLFILAGGIPLLGIVAAFFALLYLNFKE